MGIFTKNIHVFIIGNILANRVKLPKTNIMGSFLLTHSQYNSDSRYMCTSGENLSTVKS